MRIYNFWKGGKLNEEVVNRLIGRLHRDKWHTFSRREDGFTWATKGAFYLKLEDAAIVLYYNEPELEKMSYVGEIGYGRRQSQKLKRLIQWEANRRGVSHV